MRAGGSVLAMVVCVIALGANPNVSAAQSNSCEYSYDGECDEAYGTGICAEGSDSWDCRRIGPPPGAESCPFSRDGECDEPGGTGLCIPSTDTADCQAEGIDPDRVFFGVDDRIWPDSSQMPWRAIGRITFDSGGHCTGALIGPAIVLTAAHCMFGGEGPAGLDFPREFIAGASGATYIDRADVLDYYIPPQFDIHLHDTTSEVDGFDWAILTLARPIGDNAGWLTVAPLRQPELDTWAASGRTVMQGGYSADGMAFLSANIGCPIVNVWDDNTIYHECDTLQGDSGSPLFVRDGDGYRLIAVESATYPNEEGAYDFNMAVDARAFWQAVEKFSR